MRVHVHGGAYFYKSSLSPDLAIEEVRKHSILCGAANSDAILTSKFVGIVVNDSGHATGFLHDWIETHDGKTLFYVINIETPIPLRQKWASQLKQTVASFHKLGFVWGDVRADHVLIDKNENAIVINLGGGVTLGWVDFDLVGSVQGDLLGLERMMDFILNDESLLRWSKAASGVLDEQQ